MLKLSVVVVFFFAVLLSSSAVSAQTPLLEDPDPELSEPTLSEVIQQVRPAVVKVIHVGHSGAPLPASGFIFHVEEDGTAHIMTNHHVIDEAAEIWVMVEDEALFEASIVNVDTRRDIALLTICCGEFTTVDFMDTSNLYPGDEVIAIGYGADRILPRTFRVGRIMVSGEATVTRGIISAFRYYSLMDTELIQHDAPINGGNSGGPLFAPNGKVIGMNTFRFEDRPSLGLVLEGLHFAVLETTLRERLRLWDVGMSDRFGPLTGSLRHDSDGYIEAFSPQFVATADEFAVGATFTNPWSGTSLRPWSYGFYFGRSGQANDLYMYFVVHSSKLWYLYMRDAAGDLQRLHGGIVPHLNTRAGQKNHLTLFVDGRFGDLYVNNQRVTYPDPFGVAERINLGGELLTSHEGGVAIVTGFWSGHERTGYRTRYENFMGWTYSHSSEVEDMGLEGEDVYLGRVERR